MPSRMKIHKKISVNSVANILRHFVVLSLTFVMTPYIIGQLGTEIYGVWVIVLAIIGYSGLLELGIQSAVVKLVAQYAAGRDIDQLNRIVSTSYAFFLSVGLAIFLVLMLFLQLILGYFEVDNVDSVGFVIVVLGLNLVLCMPNYVLAGVVFGHQKYHLKAFLDIVMGASNALLVYLFLENGYQLLGMAFAKTVTDIVGLFLTYIICLKICPLLKIRPKFISRSSARELFTFGGKIAASATMTRFTATTEPVIVGAVLSAQWAGIYAIPKRLADICKEISYTATIGFMPLFSELDAKGDNDSARQLYLQYTRYILIAIVPLSAGLIVLGRDFLGLWIGEDFSSKVGRLIVWFGLALLLESFQPLLWRLMIGFGKVGYLVKVSVVVSAFYLVLAATLLMVVGIEGVGIAAVIMPIASHLFWFPYLCRYLGISMADHLKESHSRPFSGFAIFMLFLFTLKHFMAVSSYPELVLFIACSTAFYGFLAWFFMLTFAERKYLDEFLRKRFSDGC